MSGSANEPGAVELIDSALDLLRNLPPSAWLWWACGTVPYVLAFVMLMTQGSATDGGAALARSSFAVAAAYVWMGCTQVRFGWALRAALAMESGGKAPWAGAAGAHALIHASALLLLPFGVLSVVGAPWAVAFYQSATAVPSSEQRLTVRRIAAYASSAALRWPRQNVLCVLMAMALWLVAFINIAVLLIASPAIARMLTGEENVFGRNPAAMANSTTLAASLLMAWLCLDPLLKAVYAVRCFRTDSERTAADLRARLRILSKLAAIPAMLCATVGQLFAVEPGQLRRAIEEVMRRPEYEWSRPKPPTSVVENPFVRFTEDVMRWIADGVDWLLRLVGRAIEAIFGSRQQQPDGTGGFAPGSAGSGLAVLALLVIVGGAAMWLLVRHGRRPSRRAEEPVAQAPVVDLASEDVTPDQLPEDEWAGLAQQWVEQGDFRMAARAVFMALLATLGRGGVISIRKAKSNGDYLREFVLRTRGEGALHDQFRGCIRVFEAAWYGGHELSRDAFEAFRMRAMSVRPHAAR